MKRREMIAAAVAGVVTACGSRAAAEPARHWMSCMVCGKRLSQCEDIMGSLDVSCVGRVRVCEEHHHLLEGLALRMAGEWHGEPVGRCSTLNCRRFRPVREMQKRGGICQFCMYKKDPAREREILWGGKDALREWEASRKKVDWASAVDIDAGEGVVHVGGS